MELDDLKAAWNRHGDMLERTLAIQQQLLRESLQRRVRGALRGYLVARAAEVAIGVAVLGGVAPLLLAHTDDRLYLAIAIGFLLFTAVATARSTQMLVCCLRLDHGGPVAALQHAVASLRQLELRALKWALLGGVLFWLPAALLLFEAFTGVPALANVDGAWLAANLAFGLAVAVVGQWLARRHVERTDLGPRARRCVDALSGRGLRLAAARLDEIARFTGERADG